MKALRSALAPILLTSALLAQSRPNYERVLIQPAGSKRTVKPLVMGTHYAVTSMMPQATVAAQRILESGGNAFDAIVGGQAVLGQVAPASNGLGSDAMLLVYDAAHKKVWSINAEGVAPKLATIEWYKKNHNGTLPLNDTLLAATIPGAVDAWYILLSRWGTKSFAEVLAPALEVAEGGIALTGAQAAEISSRGLAKYPTSQAVYEPEGKRWREGDIFKNPRLARTLRRLLEAEREASGHGREAGLKAARDRFYNGDIAREMARFCEE